MRPTWSITFLILGIGVAGFAIATPYRYGAWLDPDATAAAGALTLNLGVGLQSALLHIAKLCFVAALVPAWRRSGWAASICGTVCLPLVVLSVWNAVALLALQRSARVTEARAAVEHADRMRVELASIGQRLALVGWKPQATVEAELAAERHDWRWEATSGCTNVAGERQRQFCRRLALLEGARATAIEAERLRAREAELRGELARQPAASESRQPDLVLLASWLGIALDTAENLRALLWAGVVELVEVAAFGFAGFFWSSREGDKATVPGVAVAHQVAPPPQKARRASKRRRAVKKVDGENRDPSKHQGARLEARGRSAPRDEYAQRHAVDAFVATLRHGADLRAVGSALCDAYERARERRGWPKIPPNVFGQLVRGAIETRGGYKVKASRQYYVGVALPPVV